MRKILLSTQALPSVMGTHQDYYMTPPWLIEALPIKFDLDVCQSMTAHYQYAEKSFSAVDDGLNKKWEGTVWCFPPCTVHPAQWAKRLKAHGNGIALFLGRATRTRYYRNHIANEALLFGINKEVALYTEHPVQGGHWFRENVFLAGYGPECQEALRTCDIEGTFFGRSSLIQHDRTILATPVNKPKPLKTEVFA